MRLAADRTSRSAGLVVGVLLGLLAVHGFAGGGVALTAAQQDEPRSGEELPPEFFDLPALPPEPADEVADRVLEAPAESPDRDAPAAPAPFTELPETR
jgi:hypothetical protein